jgi:hypothetical protein
MREEVVLVQTKAGFNLLQDKENARLVIYTTNRTITINFMKSESEF